MFPNLGRETSWDFEFKSSNTSKSTVHGYNCGIKPIMSSAVRCSKDKKERIVNGNTAVPYSWPWIVHFDMIGCSGTILSEHWVVTGSFRQIPYFHNKIPLISLQSSKWIIFEIFKLILYNVGDFTKAAHCCSDQTLDMLRFVLNEHNQYQEKSKSYFTENSECMVKRRIFCSICGDGYRMLPHGHTVTK